MLTWIYNQFLELLATFGITVVTVEEDDKHVYKLIQIDLTQFFASTIFFILSTAIFVYIVRFLQK